MADNQHNHDDIKRSHGETGDTVQQAAEVTKPTTTSYPDLEKANGAQVPAGSTTGTAPPVGTSDETGRGQGDAAS